jgi:hypothetical protein
MDHSAISESEEESWIFYNPAPVQSQECCIKGIILHQVMTEETIKHKTTSHNTIYCSLLANHRWSVLRIDLTWKHVNARLPPQWCNVLWQGMFPLPYLLKTKNVKHWFMTTLFAEDMWITKKGVFHVHSVTYWEVNFQSQFKGKFLEHVGALLLICLSWDITQLFPVVY